VVIYVTVTITAVLYSGGLTLYTIFGMNLTAAVWLTGLLAAVYTTWGGLKAVAWADLFQGSALLLGGLLTLVLGLVAVGGPQAFLETNQARLHMFLPADYDLLPWTGVLLGMWIPIVYYCGLNQFIVQRTLAARSLREGQLGVIFAAALWLLVPFAIVMPGMVAKQLYGGELASADQAYPILVRSLIPEGMRGFMFAAIAGAVISSLASMLNSASTILTMDLYHRHLAQRASQRKLVIVGRLATLVFVILGCLLAPQIAQPRFRGVFNFIQEFQGYISPGIVAVFLMGFWMPRAPGAAGMVGLLLSAPIYGCLHWQFGELHFLIRMLITFVTICTVMALMTWVKPLPAPKPIPKRAGLDVSTTLGVWLGGGAVIAAVVLFFVWFW
jgi:SSS family solute:Na+ symporter